MSKHEQKDFILSMAEAATAIADYLKEQGKPIAYITVMNALSVDCDCGYRRKPVVFLIKLLSYASANDAHEFSLRL